MLDTSDRQILLRIARHAIENKPDGRETESSAMMISAALNQPRASFVTLKCDDRLRGCIGTLDPVRRLSDDVAYNARAAAFRDPRFPPLASHETPLVQIEISVLGKPEALDIASRDELLKCLRPAMDGLIVETGSRRATFLPSVWESLPEPDEFVAHLWSKAGLRPDDWPSDIRLLRYDAEHFDEHATDA